MMKMVYTKGKILQMSYFYFILLILGFFLYTTVVDFNPKTMGLGFVKVDV
jgi:hypothetical protein